MGSFYKEIQWIFFFTGKSFVKFFTIFKLESDLFPHLTLFFMVFRCIVSFDRKVLKSAPPPTPPGPQKNSFNRKGLKSQGISLHRKFSQKRPKICPPSFQERTKHLPPPSPRKFPQKRPKKYPLSHTFSQKEPLICPPPSFFFTKR